MDILYTIVDSGDFLVGNLSRILLDSMLSRLCLPNFNPIYRNLGHSFEFVVGLVIYDLSCKTRAPSLVLTAAKWSGETA